MKRKILYVLWAVLFILCAGLGFIPELEGATATALTFLSVIFFVPPGLLLYRAEKQDALLIRSLSCLSLSLTVLLLILNFLTAFSSESLGLLLHYILIIVACPMICSSHWAMSLFLWSCLLMGSLRVSKR